MVFVVGWLYVAVVDSDITAQQRPSL